MIRTYNKESKKFEWDKTKDYSKTPRTTVRTAPSVPNKTQQHKDLLLYILTQTNAKNIHTVIKSSNLL